ncbi:aconitase X [Salinicola lusitanus]|uniref:aconitase X n=1 Tax=Salinicola lusitanus TaxID=1949085 RepID=UPI000DA25BFF|nr:aconitase X [Salinicola lusitanus]
MRRLESLSFYLSATDCLVEGEASGVVLTRAMPCRLGEGPPERDGAGGESVTGRALVVSCRSGSSGAGAGLLEAIHADQGPALVVLDRPDQAVALEAIVAEEILSRSLPLVVLDDARFAMAQATHLISLYRGGRLVLSGPRLAGLASVTAGGELGYESAPVTAANDGFALSPEDRRCLDGGAGPAAQAAMRVVVRMARLRGARALLDVDRMHVGSDIDVGPVGLALVARLVEWGDGFRVPTTIGASGKATTRFAEACRALGGMPLSDPASLRASAEMPWPLALCVAMVGRAPAPSTH